MVPCRPHKHQVNAEFRIINKNNNLFSYKTQRFYITVFLFSLHTTFPQASPWWVALSYHSCLDPKPVEIFGKIPWTSEDELTFICIASYLPIYMSEVSIAQKIGLTSREKSKHKVNDWLEKLFFIYR